MSEIRLDLENNGNVVSVEVVNEMRAMRRLRGKCAHETIVIDPALLSGTCKSCGKELNPIHWLAETVEHWHRLKQQLGNQAEYQKLAEAKLELRHRTKCEHCHRITRITRT